MHEVARDVEAGAVERIIAVDAMMSIRDPRLKDIASDVVTAESMWPDKFAGDVVLRLFPRDLSIDQLRQALSWIEEGKRRVGNLHWQLPRLISNAELDPPRLEALRDCLVELVSAGLRWQREWPYTVCDRPHLSGALAATAVRGLDDSKSDNWLHASVLAFRLHHREYSNDEAHKVLGKRLANLDPDENARLFWVDDSFVQSLHPTADPWQRFAQVTLHDGPVELRAERDLNWIEEALGDTARSEDVRALLLEAAIRLPPDRDQWRGHVSRLKPLVADLPSLISIIDKRLKPSKHEEEYKRWEKRRTEREKQQEQKKKEDRARWIQFWREVSERPENAFSSERSWDTVWGLWRAMSHDGDDSRASGWNRRFMEEHFGKETADRMRRLLMNIWREECPTLPSERPEDQRGTYLVRWQLGLAALYAESEDPSWATKLTDEEAKLAARYAPIELNGLPLWMDSLVDAHPEAVDAILGSELTWELRRSSRGHGLSVLVQDISYASEPVAKLFLPRLREWLNGIEGVVDNANDLAATAERLRQVIGVLLKHGDEDAHTHVLTVARQRLEDDLPDKLAFIWLPTLMRLDPALGVSALAERIRAVEPEAHSEAVSWFSVLFGDRQDAINLKAPAFSPQLLLRLLRLAYRHVRPVDDAVHESAWSPDTRDHAEDARNAILSALLEAKGEEGLATKLEMANDPLFSHFKDRIIAVAEENWAQEIDSVVFDETQAVALDRTGEAPASTNEAMCRIMCDRLSDLDDLLLSDTSPRDAWARITDERVMRREIARELRHAANGLYTVDQEAVTADEKETDIRLRSVVSEHEAVIELKRAEAWSARQTRETIHHQLVKKYMASENSRSGCLLLTLAKDRRWKHPDSGTYIDLSELMALLCAEAKQEEEMMGGSIALSVHLLDLRPRLRPQKTRKGA